MYKYITIRGAKNQKINCSILWCYVFDPDVTLMKKQFVVTHTIPQTEISALLDCWITKTHSVKMQCVHKTTAGPYSFLKM